MRKYFFLILLLGNLFMLSACAGKETQTTGTKTQTLEEFYMAEKVENVDKIIIQDGTTGNSESITEQEQINEFLSLIKNIEFTQEDNQEKRKGWRYGISLFDGKKEFKFTLSKIDNIYYQSVPDIYPIVDDYYKKLSVSKK
ncbi:hypothetical protein DRW41_03540 [Neobacillus piezotolerans]|uniref:Lipoprotein n=1 Tax=Neobacillus piezotolerans TaxID=2259171 RepID=A0A3D8GW08_9BACI|nr:hypothetical protein [Neobacillus piezotolerans]RDU38647.1 hypothetical protein DRW41_03540 [Neobacillus piezotolerans]